MRLTEPQLTAIQDVYLNRRMWYDWVHPRTLAALRRKRLVKGSRMLSLTKLGREAVRF